MSKEIRSIKLIELVVKNGETHNLLVAGYPISKLPKNLQEALEDSDSNPNSIDIYSFPEEAFLSKKDQLIALPDVDLEEGDCFIESEGLELLSITSLQTASLRIFRVTTLTKFFILCRDEVEYYCLVGRPANNKWKKTLKLELLAEKEDKNAHNNTDQQKTS